MNAILPTALLEPSLADAIVRIAADDSLPQEKRTHWTCSLRQIAAALGKPPEALPARWSALRQPVGRLHHAALGVTPKTLANHEANVKKALAWFAGAENLPVRGVPLSAAYSTLYAAIGTRLDRKTLLSFMRFCSAMGTEPTAVEEAAVDRFLAYRAEHTSLTIGIATRRALARFWNACIETVPGWPSTRLAEAPMPPRGLRCEDLPAGLQQDIEARMAHLNTVRRDHRGKRRQPCKPGTIRTRRAEIVAYIAKAVECGFPLDSLTSLREALRLEVVEAVLDAYWESNGETPSVYTIDLAWKLLSLARDTGAFTEAELERLDEMCATLDEYRQPGLTSKNRDLIRQVLVDKVWRSVIAVPDLLMAQAARRHNHAPQGAAVLAGIAVAIRFLTRYPVRVGNLASIRIGENLIRPGGPDEPYWLVFPEYEVKNRVPLEFELDAATSAMIDRYRLMFRPALLRSAGNMWLFPGEEDGHKGAATLSEQITEQVFKATGVRLTAHQFRHAAAALYLKHHPGAYEMVRRLLGHRNIATTINFYAGLETLQATKIFGALIEQELQGGQDRPSSSRYRARPKKAPLRRKSPSARRKPAPASTSRPGHDEEADQDA